MKKIIVLSLAFILLLGLCGCDSNDYKEAMSLYDQGKYSEAKEIFLALDTYEDSKEMVEKCDLGISIEECIEMIDNLTINDYTDSGFISFAFEEFDNAFMAYYSIPNEEKNRVTNADLLLSVEDEYKISRVEQEIQKKVIEEATKKIKELISSFAAASTYKASTDKEPMLFIYWDEYNPELVSGNITMYYSYENQFGGTEDREDFGSWEGTYKNGKFEITDMSFDLLFIEILQKAFG